MFSVRYAVFIQIYASILYDKKGSRTDGACEMWRVGRYLDEIPLIT